MTGRLTDENAGFVQSLTRQEFEQFCTIVQKKYKIVPFMITCPLKYCRMVGQFLLPFRDRQKIKMPRYNGKDSSQQI